jgi:hypothetical protein
LTRLAESSRLSPELKLGIRGRPEDFTLWEASLQHQSFIPVSLFSVSMTFVFLLGAMPGHAQSLDALSSTSRANDRRDAFAGSSSFGPNAAALLSPNASLPAAPEQQATMSPPTCPGRRKRISSLFLASGSLRMCRTRNRDQIRNCPDPVLRCTADGEFF